MKPVLNIAVGSAMSCFASGARVSVEESFFLTLIDRKNYKSFQAKNHLLDLK